MADMEWPLGNEGEEAVATSRNVGRTRPTRNFALQLTACAPTKATHNGSTRYGRRPTTNSVVVHPALPVRNIKDLIALSRARPGELNFASSGTGGLIHLTGEMFNQAAKVKLVHVPYKGSALFLPELLKGQIAMAFDTIAPHLPFIKAGKLRGVAVTASTRTPLLPEVPTVAESGLPGFESVASYAVFVPAATPKDIVAYLNRETVAALQSPDLKERLSTAGIDPVGSSTEELDRIVRTEIAKWAQVIRNGGIAPE